LPFLWTIFFFILTLNLLGLIPLLGSATGSVSVTGALALSTFAVVMYSGMKKMGVAGFWKAQAPHMDLPAAMKYVLVPTIWVIEVFGLFVKHLVLAVRLFANIFAGHLVLAVFVAFIGVAWNHYLSIGVIPTVIGASLAINLLELLVALIQAYVFTFLSALFIGAALHPH
jgi:F-type H+-transporting ATPase subunit a